MGAVPVTVVKMPHPFAQVAHPLKPISVRWSSWYVRIAMLKSVLGKVKQPWVTGA